MKIEDIEKKGILLEILFFNFAASISQIKKVPMKIEIGDNVAVLDDVIKGKVIAVSKGKVTLETVDGFSFDFTPKELVVIKEQQSDLSKYSDISNDSLFQQSIHEEKKRRNPIKFKTDAKVEKLPPMEVDLHASSLLKSTKGLDNFDILTVQMDTAKHKLEFAIRNRIPRVVFIHGVGEGVLKSELNYLFKNYKVEVSPASFKKYGLGATEVYILQNPRD